VLSPLAQELLRDLKGPRSPGAPKPAAPATPPPPPPPPTPPAPPKREPIVEEERPPVRAPKAPPPRALEPEPEEPDTPDGLAAAAEALMSARPRPAPEARPAPKPPAAANPEPAPTPAAVPKPEPAARQPVEAPRPAPEQRPAAAPPRAEKSRGGRSDDAAAILDAFQAQTPQQRLNPFASTRHATAIPEPEVPELTEGTASAGSHITSHRPLGVVAMEGLPGEMPRLALRVGRKFAWWLSLGLVSHMASGVLAGAAAGGAAFVISQTLYPAFKEIIGFSAFVGVMVLWVPSALSLATRYAWRAALKEEGAANAVAMALASAMVPGGNDDETGLDASGLGLYRLRERVRKVLDEALSGSIRAAWLRRVITFATSAGVDKATRKRLGPVEDIGKLDRAALRQAITHAIESALVGRG
jgi:hypothetical protein